MNEDVIKLLKEVGIEAKEDQLERPPKPEFGDVAFPTFSMAKTEKKSPNDIAKDIHERLSAKLPKGMIKETKVLGGYVNFVFDWSKVSNKLLGDIIKKGKKFGVPAKTKKQKIMVEYSQPNPVHSMHIGHARGTFLGNSLAKLYEFMGHQVIHANYMNDCGLQVAKLVTAIDMWAKGKEPDEKPDLWLWKYYVRFHEEAEKDESLEERARETLRKIDVEKDKETTELRDKIVKWCIDGFNQTYATVGIKFDMYLHESDYRDEGKKIVEEAMKRGIAFESDEKTIVADLEKQGLPGLVILRSDGTGLYQTSDLGMTVDKFKTHKVDKAIWVVASAQELYFKQLKTIFKLLGYPWVDNAIHFSFNLVRLPEGKMSSRAGRAILFDDVIKQLSDMAYEEVNKRNPDEKEEFKRATAKSIGIGALKYAIDKVEPDKGITFNFAKMLSFEGNTGPYIQYAHTRCASILEKAGKWDPNKSGSINVKDVTKEEIELMKLLSDFPAVVDQAGKEMRVNLICNHAYDVANAYSTFYQSCPVLKVEDDGLKNFRLSLVAATKVVLGNALSILGIEALEKM